MRGELVTVQSSAFLWGTPGVWYIILCYWARKTGSPHLTRSNPYKTRPLEGPRPISSNTNVNNPQDTYEYLWMSPYLEGKDLGHKSLHHSFSTPGKMINDLNILKGADRSSWHGLQDLLIIVQGGLKASSMSYHYWWGCTLKCTNLNLPNMTLTQCARCYSEMEYMNVKKTNEGWRM